MSAPLFFLEVVIGNQRMLSVCGDAETVGKALAVMLPTLTTRMAAEQVGHLSVALGRADAA